MTEGTVRRFRDKKLEASGHVQCARCGLVFRPLQSDEAARAEEMIDFGSNGEDSQLVCEPCFEAIEREDKRAEEEAKRKESAKTAFSAEERKAAEAVFATSVDVPPAGPKTLAELVDIACKAPGIVLIRLGRKRLETLMAMVRRESYQAQHLPAGETKQ